MHGKFCSGDLLRARLFVGMFVCCFVEVSGWRPDDANVRGEVEGRWKYMFRDYGHRIKSTLHMSVVRVGGVVLLPRFKTVIFDIYTNHRSCL